ncbi:TTL domain-containing protein [Cercophora newfieldiana]|uniref:TTL domain-containing protein n=1 Tax=Cercophora newfieldiana TaxID=92897 RepID=A0AA40CS53_9PEZI|nr:TTL domain-containing protein [Cercophora newfieldiana]
MYVFVEASSPWLDEHIERFISHHAPDAIFVRDLADIPSSAETVFQFCCGQELNRNFALVNKTSGLINAYPNSDALARKDYLGVVVDFWTAKRPDSILKSHVPQTVRLTLDYAEYVDEALMAADDLSLLSSLEDNEAKEPRDREYWILKPALVDCGAGIRIFSTIEELASHLELAEYEEDDDDTEDEESTEESEEEPIALEKIYDDSFSPTLSQPGLSCLDILVTTNGSGATKSKLEVGMREKKPQYVFKEGGRIPSSEMRAFVAQRYLSSIAPLENRKWHVRAYVLSVGRLKVHVFQEMLTLLAGEDYQGPWEYPSLKSSLTNTALQDEDVVESRQSMRAFWDMPEDLFPGKSDWKEDLFAQIGNLSSELFRAAAHTMADKFTTLDKCFELFAVDFLVDDKGEAWLLEVNETPAFYQQGVAGPMSLRLMESVVCVAMEHMGFAHVGEARNAAVRRRMVDVLDETAGLAKSNIVEVLADR